MEGRKLGQIGRIAGAGLAMVLLSTPAFAQEGAGAGLDLVQMFEQMGPTAMAIAAVLFIMSFWSVGVAIERFYTFRQATNQSKMYAPLVAKHLKEGRLKEAIALSSVEGVSLQPSGQGGARGTPGVSVPAGNRIESVA